MSVYFNLGEDIGSRDGRGTRLKARNGKKSHEKLIQILLHMLSVLNTERMPRLSLGTSYWKIEC